MEFKEIKELLVIGRKLGVKSFEFNGLLVTFKDEVIVSQPRKRRVKATEGPVASFNVPVPPPLPSLDEINEYIYGTSEETN